MSELGYDYTYTEKAKRLLEEKYKGFEALTDYYVVKKTGRIVNQKSNLFTMASNAYFERIGRHWDDTKSYSYPKIFLEKDLGRNYAVIIRILFDVSTEYVFKKSTKRYKPKKNVIEVFNEAYGDWLFRHQLLDKQGNVVKDTDIQFKSIRRNTMIHGKRTTIRSEADKQNMHIPGQIKMNVNNIVEGYRVYSQLKELFLRHIKKLDDKDLRLLKSAGLEMKTLTLYKVEHYQKILLEMLTRVNTAPFKYGHIHQVYNEYESGRLYNEGRNGLMNIPKHIRYVSMSGLGYYEYDMVNAHYELLRQLNEMYGGRVLNKINDYCDKPTVFRKEIAGRLSMPISILKIGLISIINGASLDWKHRPWNIKKRKKDISAILDTFQKHYRDKNTARAVADAFTKDKDVKQIYDDVKIAREHVVKNMKHKGAGAYEVLINHYGKTHRLKYKSGNKFVSYGYGVMVAHILQGLEAFMLSKVILKMNDNNKEDFLVPYHDGWISKVSIDKAKMEKYLYSETAMVLNDYDSKIKKVGIEIKISGGNLRDPFKKV